MSKTGGSKTYRAEPEAVLPVQRQACPPHSPEETYKRQVSSQHDDSIQFCNGCSARDTRPQN
jgi:hypothetical protein